MKLLEIEVDEYTTPTLDVDHTLWNPITVKFEQTDENVKIIGKQLQKQNKDYKKGKFDYKFEINLDEWLLEGCWLQNVYYFSYKDDSYMEITVRFDNATSYNEEK